MFRLCFGVVESCISSARIPATVEIKFGLRKENRICERTPFAVFRKTIYTQKTQNPQTFAIARLAGYFMFWRAENMHNQAGGCEATFRRVGETDMLPLK